MTEQTLKKILRKNVDQAEVFISSSKSLNIDVLDQKIESVDEIRDQGIGIRVIKDKKMGFAFTSEMDETSIEDAIEQAVANAENAESDEYHDLPEKSSAYSKLDLIDEEISKTAVEKKIALALEIERSAYQADPRVKKTQKISYTDSEEEVWIINSKGLDVKYRSNHCGASGDVIAVEGGEMEDGFGMHYTKKFKELKPEAIGKEAAQKATELLGAGPISSRKIPILLDPFCGAHILGVIASALSSEAVQKSKSLFAAKIGQKVGSDILNIIDNGRLENGLFSSPFDGEGTPTQETRLIENGELKTFIYNMYTARKGNTKSTGNAARGSFKSPPAVGSSNFFIPAGKSSPEEIMGSMQAGIYITRLMGVHTANPISGDFSLGAAGIMIENGKRAHPVRGVTIAGNLIEMLKDIQTACSDLRFFPSMSNLGCPSLLIEGLTVSGE